MSTNPDRWRAVLAALLAAALAFVCTKCWHDGLLRDLAPPKAELKVERKTLEDELYRRFLNQRRTWLFRAEEALEGIPDGGLSAVELLRKLEIFSADGCVAFRSEGQQKGPFPFHPQDEAELQLRLVMVDRDTEVWIELFPEVTPRGEAAKPCEPQWP